MTYTITGVIKTRPLCYKPSSFSITLLASLNFFSLPLVCISLQTRAWSCPHRPPRGLMSLKEVILPSLPLLTPAPIPGTAAEDYNAHEGDSFLSEIHLTFLIFQLKIKDFHIRESWKFNKCEEKAYSFSSRVANASQKFSYSKRIRLFLVSLSCCISFGRAWLFPFHLGPFAWKQHSSYFSFYLLLSGHP